MSNISERQFRTGTYKFLKKLPNSWFESIQQQGICGTPDVLGCVNGTFVALEYKKSKTAETSKLQKYKLEKINNAHGYGIKVYPENWVRVQALLLALSSRRPQRRKQCQLN